MLASVHCMRRVVQLLLDLAQAAAFAAAAGVKDKDTAAAVGARPRLARSVFWALGALRPASE